MRISRTLGALTIALILFPYAAMAAPVQGPLASGTYAAELEPGALPDGYVPYQLGTSGGQNQLELMLGLFARVGAPGGDPKIATLLSAVWTKGDVVNGIGESRFLVTYRLDAPDLASRTMNMGGMSPSRAATAPKLRLTLIRLDTILTISPIPNLSRDALTAIGEGKDAPLNPAAAKTASMSNLKQISLGMIMYCGDYDDVFPYVQGTHAAYEVTQPYVKNRATFKSLNPVGGEFRFAMNLGGVSATSIPNPAETPMYYDSMPWPDGTRAVAYADGHVKYVKMEDWPAIETRLRAKYSRTARRPLPGSLGMNWSFGDSQSHAVEAQAAPAPPPPPQ